MSARMIAAGLAASLLLGVASADAQPAQPPATPPAQPGSPQTIPEKPAPGPLTEGSGNLSDKLDKSEGVIKPPANVDPAISKPAPVTDPGTMPVIKPPEDRGGPVAK